MVALEEWLAAIEEDYLTFLTLPTPFTGNAYWTPKEPIEVWDDDAYKLLLKCKPRRTFQELREQIDEDLDFFGVAADYSDIIREIEQHHSWTRIENSGVNVDDPSRRKLIDNVYGQWRQVRRLSTVLLIFACPFESAERKRTGQKWAEFFESFYGGILILCRYISDYDRKAKEYQRSERERQIAIQSERRANPTLKPDAPQDSEPVFMTSPEGDLENHELCVEYMLTLEARAKLLGQIVSLRIPVLAKSLSLLNCVPSIPITDWKSMKDFPFDTLKDEVQKVQVEAEKLRLKAAELKPPPKDASAVTVAAKTTPKMPLTSVSQSFQDILGQFLEAGRTYKDLHLVVVYGGHLYDTWPEVLIPDGQTFGLPIPDWNDLLETEGRIFCPISDTWLSVEGKLWQAGFYNAGRLWPSDQTRLQYDHLMAGIDEFKRLSVLAASHFGILPKLLNVNPEWPSSLQKPSACDRWLETLFSCPEQYQEATPTNDYIARHLCGNAFIASAQTMERMEKARLLLSNQQQESGATKGEKTSPKALNAAPETRGRKPQKYADLRERIVLLDDFLDFTIKAQQVGKRPLVRNFLASKGELNGEREVRTASGQIKATRKVVSEAYSLLLDAEERNRLSVLKQRLPGASASLVNRIIEMGKKMDAISDAGD